MIHYWYVITLRENIYGRNYNTIKYTMKARLKILNEEGDYGANLFD